MKRRMIVRCVEPRFEEGRLVASCGLEGEGPSLMDARLPDRELSCLIPRCIVAESLKSGPERLEDLVKPMLERLVVGREARVWEYEGVRYMGFPPWKALRLG